MTLPVSPVNAKGYTLKDRNLSSPVQASDFLTAPKIHLRQNDDQEGDGGGPHVY